NGEYDAIADLYNSLVRSAQPSTNDEWFEVYYGYTSIGEKYGKELDSIENLIEIYPEEQLLWFYKVDYFTENSMYDEAIESLERYEELGGPEAIELKEELLKMKNTDSTTSDNTLIAGPLLKPDSGDSSSHYSFSSDKDYITAMHSAYDDGDMEKSLEIIEDGLKKFPDNSDLWSNYGALLNNLERYDEAIEATDKSISLGKTNAHAWYVKGYALEKLEKYLDAEIYYEKSLELKPENKDFKEALDRVRKLI
ncbi:MAG: tetratricopeptide repeat protein, partial [Candidatus Cloacimonetes bacterium]|nr:tetratricopeptide repeat protein [Candidatus Cloacimonadota bacterium]